MKKSVCIILAMLVITLCFSSCNKTDATKAAETAIKAIGEVSIDSLTAIEEAEAACKILSPEELKKVSNYKKLTAAREAYDAYAAFNDEIKTLTDTANTAYSAADFNIDALIAKADEITEKYNAMKDKEKEQVRGFEAVAAAKTTLEAYAANAATAATAYVRAFLQVNADKNYTVTGVFCIKEIRKASNTTEYHTFALSYKDAAGNEGTVYANGRMGTNVAADTIVAHADTYFAPAVKDSKYNAKESTNVTLDTAAILAAIG